MRINPWWLIVELFSSPDEEIDIGLILLTLVCGLQYSVALIIFGLAFNFGNNCVGSVVWRPSDWAPGIASWGRLLFIKRNISCRYTSKLYSKAGWRAGIFVFVIPSCPWQHLQLRKPRGQYSYQTIQVILEVAKRSRLVFLLPVPVILWLSEEDYSSSW